MPEPITITDPVRARDAAEMLGVGTSTIWDWIRRGKILAIKFGGTTFIPRSQVEKIQKERQLNAKK